MKIKYDMSFSFKEFPIFNAFYKLGLTNKKIEELKKFHEKIAKIYEKVELQRIDYVCDVNLKGTNKILILSWNILTNKVINIKNITNGDLKKAIFKNTFYCFINNLPSIDTNFPLKELPAVDEFIKLTKILNIINNKPFARPKKPYTSKELKTALKTKKCYEAILSRINKNNIELLGWLLDNQKAVNEYIKNEQTINEADFLNYLGIIVTVFDTPENFRIAIIKFKHFNSNYFYTIVPVDAPAYQYIDKNRILYSTLFKYNYFTEAIDHEECIYFIDNNPILPQTSDIFDAYLKHRNINRFLHNENITQLIAQYKATRNRSEKKKEQQKIRSAKIFNRILKLKTDDNLTIIINDVKYNNKQIEYEKQILKSQLINVPNFLTALLQHVEEKDLNFDLVFQTFISKVIDQCPIDNTFNNIQIGAVNLRLRRVPGVNKKNVNYVHSYINNKRINNNELEAVLQQCLCFTSTTDFKHFVSQVSKCSLKIHNYLAKGLQINAYDQFLGFSIKAKIPLIRKSHKHFIAINNHEYPIKNLNRLLAIERFRTMHQILDVFANPKIVNINISDLGVIIDKAKEAYEEAVNKSKKLLKEIEQKFKLKPTTKTISGQQRTGYIIKGYLRDYFIEDKDTSQHTSYRVFDYPSGRARCIVDKVGAQAEVGVDRLINRIYALRNDKFVANQISTI